MKKICILAVLFSILIISSSFAFEAKVLRVIDGDTIEVSDKGRILRIRFYGIDAPEKNQPFGFKSRSYLRNLVDKKIVELIPEGKSYNRLVAIVFLGDRCINEEMLKAGLAWYSSRYCKIDLCYKWKQEELEAKRQRLGLWSQNNPIAPWIWRHSRKGVNKDSFYYEESFSNKKSNKDYFYNRKSRYREKLDKKLHCRDFSTCEEAQKYFKKYNAYWLDRNKDGIACNFLCK